MSIKTFPILYQKSNVGAIQQWEICAAQKMDGAVISTTWGQVGGAVQTTTDFIRCGKNIGKVNETTALEQACKEAESKWLKQKKKGYVETIEQAQAGEVDEAVITGGVAPMLSPNKSYPKDPDLQKRIKFPAYAQPKLDGMRCVAVIREGKCTLWSRTRKPIRTVPHIVETLEKLFPADKHDVVILDGELYNHEYRNTFEDLISILRKDAPDAEGLYKVVEYHVYDVINSDAHNLAMECTFDRRLAVLHDLLPFSTYEPIHVVHTWRVESLEAFNVFYEKCVEDEYEGAMARNFCGSYESDKRSVNLMKAKPFQDAEFTIVGANEGRGKDAGTVGAFNCVTDDGKPFKARLKAPYARRRELFAKQDWIGKKLTVTLKRFTQDGVPYLPIAKAIRDYE